MKMFRLGVITLMLLSGLSFLTAADTEKADAEKADAEKREIDPALDAMIQEDWTSADKIDGSIVSYLTAARQHLARALNLLENLRDPLSEEEGNRFEESLRQLSWESLQLEAQKGDVSADEAKAHYLAVRYLKREIAFANPLADFGELLFCKRVTGNYNHLVQQYFGWRARRGGGLYVLTNPGYSLECRSVLPKEFSHGSTLEPRLSYDGKEILFSWVDCPDEPYSPLDVWPEDVPDKGFYHLYRVGIDGSNLTQITNDSFDDTMPNWLPDGGIIFCSTRRLSNGRCHWWGIGHRWNTYTLHRCDRDGSNIETLSWNDTNEWFPVVDETGLIYYARWDYIDRDAVAHQNLWSTRPDGTNPQAVWGNASPMPLCTFQIQPIPGTGKFLAVGACHHAQTGGPLIEIDPKKGVDGLQSITKLTPEIPYPESDETKWQISIPEFYESPWPLSEDYYLISYSPTALGPEGSTNAPNQLGIYLLDRDGNRELIYRDPIINSLNAVPIQSRPVPPVIQSQLPKERPGWGEVSITDVYEGLGNGIQRGEIKELRIVQIFPKTTRDWPPIGLAGEENGRAILGTVPVEEDGSAYFRVPAQKPILFQAIDKEGRAYQTMRSLTYLQPGEQISCVGCHENRDNNGFVPANYSARPTGSAIAMRREPSEIEPGELGGRPFSYAETVQPILDAKCVSCHNAERTDGNLNLTGTVLPKETLTGMKLFGEGNFNLYDAPADCFTESYFALCGRGQIFYNDPGTDPNLPASVLVPRFGGRNKIQMTRPGGEYGAIGCRLIKLLDAGHEGVELTDSERRALCAWVDMNAIFYGLYDPDDQKKQLAGERMPMPEIQ